MPLSDQQHPGSTARQLRGVERPAYPGDSDEGALGHEWITRADAAKLGHVSIDTVDRRIAEHGLRTRVGPRQTKYVFVPDLKLIGLIPADVAGPGTSATDAAELVRVREQVVLLREELAATRARLEGKDELIAALKAEDGKKDRLLTSLARTNESLAAQRTAVDVR